MKKTQTITITPDYDWYKSVSKMQRSTNRCPFAQVRRCPRYFYSRSLLGDCGSTPIEKELDEELTRLWQLSEFAPTTDEDMPSVTQSGDKHPSFWKFCPEVMFDRFGWFVSDLSPYADEIDEQAGRNMLERLGLNSRHPRWIWSAAQPMHYSDCPQYSLLQQAALNVRPTRASGRVATWWKRNEVIGWTAIAVTLVTTILAMI